MPRPTCYIKRLRPGDRLHVAVCDGGRVVGEVMIRLRQLGVGSAELLLEADRSTIYTDERALRLNEGRGDPRKDS
jgi:hypothetical protein